MVSVSYQLLIAHGSDQSQSPAGAQDDALERHLNELSLKLTHKDPWLNLLPGLHCQLSRLSV